MAFKHSYPTDQHKNKVKVALQHSKEGKLEPVDFEAICIEIVANVLHVPSALQCMGLNEEYIDGVCDTAVETLMNYDTQALKALSEALENLKKEEDDKWFEHCVAVAGAYIATLP